MSFPLKVLIALHWANPLMSIASVADLEALALPIEIVDIPILVEQFGGIIRVDRLIVDVDPALSISFR